MPLQKNIDINRFSFKNVYSQSENFLDSKEDKATGRDFFSEIIVYFFPIY